MEKPGHLKAVDGVLLTAHEAEHIVENLKCFSVKEVGCPAWMKQHRKLEKLNLQAHYNTIAHCDEFIMEALLSFEKLGVLIHELLAIEIWKEKVLPHIMKHLAGMSSTIRLSLIFYQEVTVIKLFEIMLFHKEACKALGSSNLLELVDYCYRKLVYLNTNASKDAAYKERTAQQVMSLKPELEMEEKAGEIQFGCAIASLTILRYMLSAVADNIKRERF
ncbi:zinc finger MYND domain-containing protein 10-like isoform X2 [Selaginella moellendorffii]|uniref:zinc finger MYND domain-containing protein 10-like isoform X2 n=1 Tax=Selaginella moellendorffii TaxID=88036 RepID=UPI000D1CC6D7|nr:zinc finger MYND domain-containing protein 10-like isoform X2 [Selaginella moellendorffii]|eukprot:XP_024529904.1 zinc finger MYND domain-containing protein 10-like isoform X2 [Selaginella moellendorffii]